MQITISNHKRLIALLFSIILATLISGCAGDDVPPPIGTPEATQLDSVGPFHFGQYKRTFINRWGIYGADIYYPADNQGNPNHSSGPYPIMAFSPGLGAVKEFNTWVGEHLATHGYIVMVFSVPIPFVGGYNEQREGLLQGLEILENDGSNPETPIYGITDTTKKIIGGHSMGAMGSLAAASEAADLSAVVALAPIELSESVLAGVSAPTQIQGGTQDCITRSSGAIGSYNNLPVGITKQVLIINGGNHVGFNDAGSLAAIAGDLLVDCSATVDIFDHQQRLSRRYMTAWLDFHVKGDTSASTYIYGPTIQQDLDHLFLTELDFE